MVPKQNDRILILKFPWLGMLLSGEKTLEIRPKPYTGVYWLGHKKLIYAKVEFGQPRLIRDDHEWQALREQHKVNGDKLYDKTFGMPVVSCRPLKRTIPFHHPRGAVTIVKFRQ